MSMLLLGLSAHVIAAIIAPFISNARMRSGAAVVAGVLGPALMAPACVNTLLSGESSTISSIFPLPLGAVAIALDPLAAFFMLPILLLSPCAAVYGAGYWKDGGDRRLGWTFFHLLVVGMSLTVLAADAIFFLASWEVMSFAAYFLVTMEHEKEESRSAGLTYLFASQIGVTFLIVMFLLLTRGDASFAFDALAVPAAFSASGAAVFLLAVVGFGAKAGFLPLHVWLPEAHPAAPSHVSALMSGAMIKVGMYGLCRAVSLFDDIPLWWGVLLILVGAVSGIWSILAALGRHDLKELLAYSSIENIGIITLGLGLGMFGKAVGSTTLAVLGYCGAFLHLLNHSVIKGVLFFAAGAVYKATGSRMLEGHGGLMKALPRTGFVFLIGSAAIAGLPPLNGFIGEATLLLGAFEGVMNLGGVRAAISAGVLASIALIGGLAVACFSRTFGLVFLGAPRIPREKSPADPSWHMLAPMFLLAALAILLGLFSPWILGFIGPTALRCAGMPIIAGSEIVVAHSQMLSIVTMVFALFALAAVLFVTARLFFLRGRSIGRAVTWDCGYIAPQATMQYTASSFSQPLLFSSLFRHWLKPKRQLVAPTGFFPAFASMKTKSIDIFKERLYLPIFTRMPDLLSNLQKLQEGRVQLYILYIAVTLIVLLVWKVG